MLTPSVIRAIARAVLLTYAIQIPIAGAQVVADPNARAGQKPIIDRTANGVLLVHIAPPSAGGVSQNQYKDFNVGKEGLILNNALGITNTELGGQVPGNLQLSTQPARIILNEVTGTSNSQLKGYIEVAGQRADIIVANPNGITCDGCGFLNTARATLTTGSAHLTSGGELAGIDVTRGEVRIGQGGLNASNIGQLDLLARGIVIEGEVWAQQLNAVLGANTVLYGTLKAQPLAGSGAAPRFVVDIASLGGMYAKQIYLVANERGVGVNSAGRIAALESNLTLSANGDLHVADVYAKQGLDLSSTGNVVTTASTSAETIRVKAGGTLENHGAMDASTALSLDAPTIANAGVIVQRATDRDLAIEAGNEIRNDGVIYSASNLQLQAPKLTGSAGRLLSEGTLAVRAGDIDTSNAQWLAGKSVSLDVAGNAGMSNTSVDAQGTITARVGGALGLTGSTLRTSEGLDIAAARVDATSARLGATGNLTVSTPGALSIEGAVLSGVASVSIDAASLGAASASMLSDGNTSVRVKGDMSARDAVVVGARGVDVGAGNVGGGAYLAEAGDVSVYAADRLDLNGGGVAAGQQANLAANAISTAGGLVQARDIAVASRAAALDNRAGAITATNSLDLSGQGIDNRSGLIQSAGTASLNTGGLSVENAGGVLVSNGALCVTGAALNNQAGSVETQQDLLLGLAVNNAGGLIHSGGKLTLDAASSKFDNRSGVVLANSAVSVSTRDVDNRGGLIRSQTAEVSLATGGLLSDAAGGVAGTVAAATDLTIRAKALSANAGQLVAGNTLALEVDGDARLDGAQVLSAGGELRAKVGGALSASGAQIASSSNAVISASDIRGGSYSAGASLAITSANALDVSEGVLVAGATLDAKAGSGVVTRNAKLGAQQIHIDAGSGSLDNQGGVIVAESSSGTALQIKSAGINNRGGQLVSSSDMVLDAGAGALDNSGGQIGATGLLDLRSRSYQGAKGSLSTGGDLTLASGAIDNSDATLSAGGRLLIDTQGQTLNNAGGQLLAGRELTLSAGAFDNTNGRIAGTAGVTVTVDSLAGRGGRIETGTTAKLDSHGTMDLAGAAVNARGDIDLTAASLTTAGATLVTDGALAVSSSALDNRAGTLSAGKALTLTTGDADNTAGRLLSGAALTIRSGEFNNDAGVLSAVDSLSLNTDGKRLGNQNGALVSKADISVQSAGLRGAYGQIDAGRGVTLNLGTADVLIDGGAIRAADGDIVLSGGALSARNVRIETPRDLRVITAGAADVSASQLAAGGSFAVSADAALNADDATLLSRNGVSLAAASISANRMSVSSDGAITIDARSGALQANAAQILSGGSLALRTPGALDLRGAQIESRGDLSVAGGLANASGARIITDGAAILTTAALNADGVALSAAGPLKIDAGINDVSLRDASVQSGQHVELTAGAVSASRSVFAAGTDLTIRSGALTADASVLSAALGKLTVVSDATNLQNAQVAANGNVDLTAGALNAAAMQLASNGTTHITASDVSANGATLDSLGDVSVRSAGEAGFDGGSLKSGGTISVQSDGGMGAAIVVAAGRVDLVAGGAGRFAGAQVGAGGALDVQVQGLDSSSAKFVASDITLNAGTGAHNNRAGQILADGTLHLTAGALDNANGQMRASTGISVTATSMSNRSGTVATAGAMTVSASAGDVDNTDGKLLAGNDLTLSTAGAVLNDRGMIAAAHRATLGAGEHVSNRSGQIVADDALSLTARGVDNQAGVISAGAALNVASSAGSVNNTAGAMLSGGSAVLDAAQLTNRDGQLGAVGDFTIHAGALALDNRGGDIHSSAGKLMLQSGALDNSAAGRIAAAGALDLRVVGDVDNRGAAIEAGAATTIHATGTINNATGSITTLGSLALSSEGLVNAGGTLTAGSALEALAGSGDIDNHGGSVNAQGPLSISTAGAFDNQLGRLQSNAGLLLVSGVANNTSGVISAGGNASISTSGFSNAAGQVLAGNNLQLDARGGVLDSVGGTLGANNNLSLSGAAVNIGGLHLGVGGELSVTGGAINAASSQLESTGKLVLDSGPGVLDLTGARLRSNDSVRLAGGNTNAAGIDVAANGSVAVSGSNLTLSGATIVSGVDVSAAASGSLNARNAVLTASRDVGVSGGAADLAAAQLSAGRNLDLASGAYLDLSAGGTALAAGNDLAVRAEGLSVAGRSFDVRKLVLNAGAGLLVATGSTLLASDDAELRGNGIDTRSAVVGVSGALALDAGGGVLDNRGGQLASVGNLNVNAGSVRNEGGVLGSESGATTIAASGSVTNANGRVVSAGATAVHANGIDNAGGLISGSAIDINAGAGSLNNSAGVLSGLDRAAIVSGSLNNDAGVIEAGVSGLTLTTGALSNRNSGSDRGIVTTGDAVLAVIGALDNTSGYIGASRTLTLNAGSITNAAGTLGGTSALAVTTGALDNQGGTIQSSGNVSVTATSLDNRSNGLVFAGGNLTANVGQIDNRDTRTGAYDRGLLAGGDLNVSGANLDNRNGAVVAGSTLTVGVSGALDNSGGQLAGDRVTLAAANFTNTAGRVDAERKLTTRFGNFSADGVMASNGSLDITLASDYTNTGTLAASGDLSITTTGNYTNAGKLSATNLLSLMALNLNNQASGEIVGGSTVLNVSGTLNNDGVINAVDGSTQISAGTLNNNGSIFGDSVRLSGGAVNNGAAAVIASRGALDANLASLTNRDDGLIYGAGDVAISAASITNSSATIQAGNRLTLTGSVTNTTPYRKSISESTTSGPIVDYVQAQDGVPLGPRAKGVADEAWAEQVAFASMSDFAAQDPTRRGAPMLYTARPAGAPDAIYIITGSDKNYRVLHPDVFGTSQPYAEVTSDICNLTGGSGASCVTQKNYTAATAPWAVMGVTPPSVPEPASYCKTWNYSGSYPTCSQTDPDWDLWQTAWGQLNTAIQAHNTTVAAQNEVVEFEDYLRYSYTSNANTTGSVGDRPAQLLAGSDLVVNGALTNDHSTVSAGGSVIATVAANIGSTLTRTSTNTGTLTDSRVESSGWSGGHTRTYNDSAYSQSTGAQSVEYVDYKVITSHASGTPGVPTGPLPSAGSGAASVPTVGANASTTRGPGAPASVDANGGSAGSGGSSSHPAAVGGTPIRPPAAGGPGAVTPGDTAPTSSDPSAITAQGSVDLASSGIGGSPSSVAVGGPSLGGVSTVPGAPLPGSVIAAGARATQVAMLDAVRTTFAKAAAERATRVDAARVAALADATEHAGIGVHLALGAPDGARAAVERGSALDGSSILTGRGRISAPDNKLFTIHAEPGFGYLVETDPRFTNYKQFISSQYFIDRLAVDPASSLKRYGDGFAEQRLIEQQVRALTGRQMLAGYADTEAQYLALMNAGIAFAEQYQFSPGVALSAEQMARLTTDIVWLETAVVDTAQGPQTVLIPRVYLHAPQAGDLLPSGGLIAGSDVVIRNGAGQALANSGTIAGQRVSIDAGELANQGTIRAADSLAVRTAGDLANNGGRLSAGGNLDLLAGGKLVVRSEAITLPDGNSFAGRTGTIYAGGDMTAYAGQSLTLAGAQLDAQGRVLLASAGDITLDTLITQTRTAVATARGGQIGEAHTEQTGTRINGAQDIALIAGLNADGSRNATGDIRAVGADIKAGGTLALDARAIDIQAAVAKDDSWVDAQRKHGFTKQAQLDERLVGGALTAGGDMSLVARAGDIHLAGAQLQAANALTAQAAQSIVVDAMSTAHSTQYESADKKRGLISSKSTQQRDQVQQVLAEGSTVSAGSISMDAGKDLLVRGSSVVADRDVALSAAGKVSIEAAQDQLSEQHFFEEKKSGFAAAKQGIGISYNRSTQRDEAQADATQQSQARASVGSLGGNVVVRAGSDLHIGGSDIAALRAQGDTSGLTGHIALEGASVTIDPGQDRSHTTASSYNKSSELGMSLVGTPLDAARNIKSIVQSDRSLYSKAKLLGNELGAAAADTPQVAMTLTQRESQSRSEATSVTQAGSRLTAAGDIQIRATGSASGGDITIAGSSLSAGERIVLDAQRDLAIVAASDAQTNHSETQSRVRSVSTAVAGLGDLARAANNAPSASGVKVSQYNAGKADARDTSATQSEQGSTLAAREMVLTSRTGDIAINGSTLAASGDIDVRALTGKLSLGTSLGANQKDQFASQSVIGDISEGNGTSISIGRQAAEHASSRTQQGNLGSLVTSSGGNVTLAAADRYTQLGSRVEATQGDVSISGKQVDITAAADTEHLQASSRTRSSGLTLAVESPIISAVQTMEQMAATAAHSTDRRTQALAVATGALAGANAASAVKADPKAGGGITVSLTVGTSSSKTNQTQDAREVVASGVSAGRDLTITASGAGAESRLNVVGSDLIAARNATLAADGSIALLSAQNEASEHRDNHASSVAVGVAASYGSNGMSFGITARASAARGKADGADVVQRDTLVAAGDTLTLKSGGDATLAGAQARGDTIVAKVGGDLNIESRQDTSRYKSLDQSASGSVTVGYGFSASASASQQKIDADYASVQRQSGLMAGDGGFDVTVAGNTALTGAVISSSQAAVDAGRNQLTTASLTSREIENHAEYSASSISLSGGISRGPGTSTNDATTPRGGEPKAGSTQPGLFGAPTGVHGNSSNIGVPGVMAANDEDRSTTTSGLSQGRLTLTGSGATVPANLDRGVTTDSANPAALGNNFDAEKIRQGFAVTGAFTQQLGTFTANRAAEADAIKAARDKLPPGSDAWKAADAQYQDAAKWAPGGDYGRVATVLAAAASGNVTASTTALVQNAAVGYLQSLGAEQVKHLADSLMQDGKPTADSEAVRSALHALVGCAGAAAASQSCGAGAMGAASSVVINHVLDAVQGTDASTLSAADKENRKNLVGSLVAGIAMAAGQSGAAATANSAAQVEMENNFLVGRQPKQFADRFKACAKAANRASCETQVTKDIAQTQKANGEKLNDCLLRKDTACLDRIKNDIVNAEGYSELAAQGGPDLTQVAREEGARAADIADKCRNGTGLAGCSLLKWAADSVVALAYGAVGGSTATKTPVKGGTSFANEGAVAGKPALNGANDAATADVVVATKPLALPAPKLGEVTPNAMSPAETVQASDIVAFRGGKFVGQPTSNTPGIDGWLDGVPVSLKEVTGNGMTAVQRNVIGGAKQMKNAEQIGDMYVDATKAGVTIQDVTDWVRPGSPISNILNEGTVNQITIKTANGWVTLTRAALKAPRKP